MATSMPLCAVIIGLFSEFKIRERRELHIAAGCATAPRLCEVGSVHPSPHSRLRRQCGVMQVVTARAVNIDGYQFITPIRHLTHNRASGCNFNNPLLTASISDAGYMGLADATQQHQPRERLQTQQLGDSRPVL